MSKIPDFTLLDSQKNTFTEKNCLGQYTLMYFYPKDNTSGCTKQSCFYRDLKDFFHEKGIQIIGVNHASTHEKFIKKYDLNFPILCDENLHLCQALGVWKQKSMYGRKYMGIERSCFLIDPQGEIIWEKRNVSLAGHHEELLKVIETTLVAL